MLTFCCFCCCCRCCCSCLWLGPFRNRTWVPVLSLSLSPSLFKLHSPERAVPAWTGLGAAAATANRIWCRFVKCPSKSFLCLNKASNVYIKCCRTHKLYLRPTRPQVWVELGSSPEIKSFQLPDWQVIFWSNLFCFLLMCVLGLVGDVDRGRGSCWR